MTFKKLRMTIWQKVGRGEDARLPGAEWVSQTKAVAVTEADAS